MAVWRVWDEAIDDDGSLTVVDAPTAEEAVAVFILDHAEGYGIEPEDFRRLYASEVTATDVLVMAAALEEADGEVCRLTADIEARRDKSMLVGLAPHHPEHDPDDDT